MAKRRSKRRRYGPGLPSDGRVMPHKIDADDRRMNEMAESIDLRRPPLTFGVPPDPPHERMELAEELYRDPRSASDLINNVQIMTANPRNGPDC